MATHPTAPLPGRPDWGGLGDARAERRYAGASRAERDAARRARLVAAGLQTFGEEGYAATTIEGLCARASVSTRHFYDHFHSREELLTAVYDGIIAQLRDGVVEALGTSDDFRTQMRAGIAAYVMPLLAEPGRARIVHLEVIGVSPALERHRRSMIHAFAGILEAEARRLLEPSALARRDLRLVSLGLVGAATELMIDWVTSGQRAPVDALIDELVNIFVSSLTSSG